jgi:hypothetical protein
LAETAVSSTQKAAGGMWLLRGFLPSAFCLLLSALCVLSAANLKLYLTDGTYQLVREYKVEGDRVRFYSIDRDDWEEVPASLVDLNKTQAEVKAREESVRQESAAEAAEEKAERQARQEVARVPQEPGVYLIQDDKLVTLKPGESKVVNNKGRNVLKVLSPVPLVSGKSTLELDGPHSQQGTADRSPEFFIRLSEDERFGIVRMGEHKGNRVVEKMTIQPVVKEVTEEPDLVEIFRQQVGDELFKIWPQKPLEPGEYGVVQFTPGKTDMQVWDFFVAPGTGK